MKLTLNRSRPTTGKAARRSSPSGIHRGGQRGFLFIELLISMSVFGMGLLVISSSMLSSEQTRRKTVDRKGALEIVQSEMSRLKAQGFAATLAEVSERDDKHMRFTAHELDRHGKTGGLTRALLDETAKDSELPIPMGFPRDLDGDGESDNSNVTEPIILPLVISVEWEGVNGDEVFAVPLLIYKPTIHQ